MQNHSLINLVFPLGFVLQESFSGAHGLIECSLDANCSITKKDEWLLKHDSQTTNCLFICNYECWPDNCLTIFGYKRKSDNRNQVS